MKGHLPCRVQNCRTEEKRHTKQKHSYYAKERKSSQKFQLDMYFGKLMFTFKPLFGIYGASGTSMGNTCRTSFKGSMFPQSKTHILGRYQCHQSVEHLPDLAAIGRSSGVKNVLCLAWVPL